MGQWGESIIWSPEALKVFSKKRNDPIYKIPSTHKERSDVNLYSLEQTSTNSLNQRNVFLHLKNNNVRALSMLFTATKPPLLEWCDSQTFICRVERTEFVTHIHKEKVYRKNLRVLSFPFFFWFAMNQRCELTKILNHSPQSIKPGVSERTLIIKTSLEWTAAPHTPQKLHFLLWSFVFTSKNWGNWPTQIIPRVFLLCSSHF